MVGRKVERTLKVIGRRALRQADIDTSQMLSEEFKSHLQNIQYLQTAGNVLTIADLRSTCECNCIVMLTGLVEKGRSKCELYFPLGKKGPSNEPSYYSVTTTKIHDRFTFDSRSTTLQYEEEETVTFEELNIVQHGKFEIIYDSEENLDECVIRRLELVLKIALHVLDLMNRKNQEEKFDNNAISSKKTKRNDDNSKDMVVDTVKVINRMGMSRHLHNGGLPKNFKQRSVEKKKSPEGRPVPIIAHCSAGIGRTGCFLAILNGIQQLRSNFNVDVLAILCSLRLHRGGMVQNAEQYELIHRVLNLYVDLM
ncbi:receptor-type tyrosine-protein phosphatase [Holotrichia oblita]|uniref:Receptor-type tyrosine-protein phosphatase n=1 Tax=Holotrichia oblita TaxID=644536 RepID=A0ACB9SMM4_HOLOL|nr:receptor-type tyrosine-protein phosphatase [Holotrichia oblita]